MRNRSNAILAENLEDFLFQAKHPKVHSPSNHISNELNFQLINLDFLSINEDADIYDSLSSNKKYTITFNTTHKEKSHKSKITKNIIPLKLKRAFKKKRKFLIDNTNKSDTIKVQC